MWLYGMGEGWWDEGGGGGVDKVCGCMWLYETGKGGGGWRDGCKDAS